MQSTVIFTADDRPARDPARICDACGRRGTFARITRGTEPPDDQHFCRRCWPAAHRRALDAQKSATLAWFRAGHAAFWDFVARGGTQPPPDSSNVPPVGLGMAWHWSLTLGTWWREYHYRLRASEVAATMERDEPSRPS
jgi:hypothetical protein